MVHAYGNHANQRMNAEKATTLVLGLLSTAFVAVAGVFLLAPSARPSLANIPLVAAEFTNTATARVSSAELIRSGGDASGLDCYACHDKAKHGLSTEIGRLDGMKWWKIISRKRAGSSTNHNG